MADNPAVQKNARLKMHLKTDGKTSARMARTPGRDNDLEKVIRRTLFAQGLRFRVHYRVPNDERRTIDIAFPGLRVAVFVDGCFWHGCPAHATWPKRNAGFWREKIETNRRRDRGTNAKLRAEGWRVLRIWQHEAPQSAVRRIGAALSRRSLPQVPGTIRQIRSQP